MEISYSFYFYFPQNIKININNIEISYRKYFIILYCFIEIKINEKCQFIISFCNRACMRFKLLRLQDSLVHQHNCHQNHTIFCFLDPLN